MSDATGVPSGWRRLGGALGVLERPGEDPSAPVIGLISIGVVLAAEAARRETYARTVEAVAIVVVLYWFAHAYAYLHGARIAGVVELRPRTVGLALVHEVGILRGSLLPLLALLACWAVRASLPTAIFVDLIFCAVGIFVLEMAAALHSRLRAGTFLLETLVTGGMGVSVLALWVILH